MKARQKDTKREEGELKGVSEEKVFFVFKYEGSSDEDKCRLAALLCGGKRNNKVIVQDNVQWCVLATQLVNERETKE